MLLQFNLNRQDFEVSENKAGVDEELEVSLREGEVGRGCHNTLHSRLFAGPFCFALLISRPAFPKVNRARARAFSIDHLSMQAV